MPPCELAQEKRLKLVEEALRLRAANMRAKSDAALQRRQKCLKQQMQCRRLLIERSRLEHLRRLYRRRNKITLSVTKPLCPANKLRSARTFQLLVPPAREGFIPPDPFTALSAHHLAYMEARLSTRISYSRPVL